MLLSQEKQEYTPLTVMARPHADRCYIFDLADDGMLIASRAPFAEEAQSESIRAYLSLGTWEELRAHLLSYSVCPMVVDTHLGTGVVLPTLTPDASLGVLCIPTIPRDLLVRLAGCGRYGDFVLASSLSDIRIRQSSRTEAARPAFLAWTNELLRVFDVGALPTECDRLFPINVFLRERAHQLASYLGCPIEWHEYGDVTNYGDFELPLFTAFLLNALCLARRVATNRRAYVSIGTTNFGCTVGVRFLKREGTVTEHLQELLSLRALAERKNLLFDYAEGEGMLHIRFAPVSKDWSYLELKTPDLFGWISHS